MVPTNMTGSILDNKGHEIGSVVISTVAGQCMENGLATVTTHEETKDQIPTESPNDIVSSTHTEQSKDKDANNVTSHEELQPHTLVSELPENMNTVNGETVADSSIEEVTEQPHTPTAVVQKVVIKLLICGYPH